MSDEKNKEKKTMIYNRGRKMGDKTVARKFEIPADWDENGHAIIGQDNKPVVTIILPDAHVRVTQKQLDHLKKLFPNEIINVEDANDMQKEFMGNAQNGVGKLYTQEEVNLMVAQDRAKHNLAQKEGLSDEEAGLKDGVAKETNKDAEKSIEGEIQKTAEIDENDPKTRQGWMEMIDKMDKGDLTAFAEQKGIKVDQRKSLESLKEQIFSAVAPEKDPE